MDFMLRRIIRVLPDSWSDLGWRRGFFGMAERGRTGGGSIVVRVGGLEIPSDDRWRGRGIF